MSWELPLRSKSKKTWSRPKRPLALCLGETSWDIRWVVEHLPGTVTDTFASEVSEGPGGCAANTALDLAIRGYRSHLLGNTLGKDKNGHLLAKIIRKTGVEFHSTSTSSSATPICQVFVEEKGADRCFALYHKSVATFDRAATKKLRTRAISGDFQAIFVQCYPRTLAQAFLMGAKFPLGTFLMTQDLPPTDPLIRCFDMIQISWPEEKPATQKSVVKAATSYFVGRCTSLIITQGSRGAWLIESGKKPLRLAAKKIRGRIVDTTGCGDAFRAGLMAGILDGKNFTESAARGARWGAEKARMKGSNFLDEI